MIAWAHHWPYLRWILPVLVGAAGGAYLARLLVIKFAPTAEGSGVQRVEAVFSGEVKPASMAIVPVKFFGGLLAMGSRPALWDAKARPCRWERRSASWCRAFCCKKDEDRRVVEAASAGAGLAVAFNAPIGGSIFVFEELTSNITPWLLVSTLAAATVAVWLMRMMLGNTLSFTVPQVSPTGELEQVAVPRAGRVVWESWAQSTTSIIMALLRPTDKMLANLVAAARRDHRRGWWDVVAWFVPGMVGGGESLTQAILSNQFQLGQPGGDLPGAISYRPAGPTLRDVPEDCSRRCFCWEPRRARFSRAS